MALYPNICNIPNTLHISSYIRSLSKSHREAKMAGVNRETPATRRPRCTMPSTNVASAEVILRVKKTVKPSEIEEEVLKITVRPGGEQTRRLPSCRSAQE